MDEPTGFVARRRALRALLSLLAVPLLFATRPLPAQTVFEVQGGGSTLFDGYGGLLNFWHPRFDGWAGIGWQDGWRVGAFARTEVGRDTLRLGNDVVVVRLPTDVFGSGSYTLVQGATLVRARDGATYQAFAGASSTGVQAPLFSATRAEHPFGALQAMRPLRRDLSATAQAIFSGRQSAFLGLEWRPTAQFTGAVVGGAGANRPYGAASALYSGRHVDWRVAFVGSGHGFQRVHATEGTRTEVEGANFSFSVRPTDAVHLSVGRQQFRRDSMPGASVTATAYNASAGASVFDTRLMLSVFRSTVAGQDAWATAAGIGRSIGSRLGVEYYFLHTTSPVATSRSSVVRLKETISRRLTLSQHVSVERGPPRGGVGGTVLLPFGTVNLEYQLQHVPFDQARPFQQSLVISTALQIGDYRTSVSTQLDPRGRVAYSATGSTFLYLNGFGGVQPQTVGISLERFMVRGIVRDEEGNPVEGAAVDVEGEVAYTNRSGEFFVRVQRPRAYRLGVLTDEFLTFERYEVVSLPETAEAARAADAVPAIIVVRRQRPPGATPPPAAPDPVPPPADSLQPPPAIPVPPATAAREAGVGPGRYLTGVERARRPHRSIA